MNAIIVTSISKTEQRIAVPILGTGATSFEAYRTTKSPRSGLNEIQEKYHYLGTFELS
jgi:hypothetical protein